MFDKKQYVIDSFLKLQKHLIEKQNANPNKKINAKRAFIHFLMPNLNINKFIIGDIRDWKQIYQSIPSKSLHEYTVDDIYAEGNADFLLEMEAFKQLVKNKLIITIKSNSDINNKKFYSELKLDIFNIHDIKHIHNYILSLFPNYKAHTRLKAPLKIENQYQHRHNIQFIEHVIKDESGNVVFGIKQKTDKNSIKDALIKREKQLKDNQQYLLFKVEKDQSFEAMLQDNNVNIAQFLSKIEFDISNHDTTLNCQYNNNGIVYKDILIESTYQDFYKASQIQDFFIQNNSYLTNIQISNLDFFYGQNLIRYDLIENQINEMGIKEELSINSFKDNLPHYKVKLDINDYVLKNEQRKDNTIQSKTLHFLKNGQYNCNNILLKDLSNFIHQNVTKDGMFQNFNVIKTLKTINALINNNRKYLENLLIQKYIKNAKYIENRLKAFKHYVLLFNPEIKEIYYSGILNNGIYKEYYLTIEHYFNDIFNSLSVIQKHYPTLTEHIVKYKQENKGLFPLIINKSIDAIMHDANNLLSYENNKEWFQSKNQFKMLNKKKSPILTKIYMNICLHDTYFYVDIDKVYKQVFECRLSLENTLNINKNTNIQLRLFWLLMANNKISKKQIAFLFLKADRLSYIYKKMQSLNMLNDQKLNVMLDIIIQHLYNLLLKLIQSNNQIDWRTSLYEIMKKYKESIQITRDIKTIDDFVHELYKYDDINQLIHNIKVYLQKEEWFPYFKNTNNYDEIVNKCLTEKIDNKILLEKIREKNKQFILPIHKELKLNHNSTFNSIIAYINEYNKFNISQQHIIDNESVNYNQYPISIEKVQFDDISINPILNSFDLMSEGSNMNHCVYSYRNSCNNAEYVVFHISDNTKYDDGTGKPVIRELTLGLSINKNQYLTTNGEFKIKYKEIIEQIKQYKNKQQNIDAIKQSPDCNDLYFQFSQCYGNYNDYIVHEQQKEKINIAINKLIYQLNLKFLESVGL